MSNNAGSTLLALLTGAAIGAGVGILFAPEKGSQTRGKIKDGFEESKKEIKFKLEKATQDLKSKFSIAKSELEETFDEMVSKMSNKTEDVITVMETKLSELKSQNAKLQNGNSSAPKSNI